MIDDEEMTARLLRLSEPRPAVPAERADRVQQAITIAWRKSVQRRVRRQRLVRSFAFLAAAAAILLLVRLRVPVDSRVAPPARGVAVVERLEGPVDRVTGDMAGEGSRTRLTPRDSVKEGDWVETAATARAALALSGGVSLRVDTGTRARLVSGRVIELALGALYIDTGTTASALEVRTPFGVAQDIGTQFEVRLERASLRLRVRSGQVRLRGVSRTITVQPETELVVTADDALSRAAPPFGPEWEWTARLGPTLDIEGRPLASYLAQVCREQGWTLRYDEERLAEDAERIVLNGSVKELPARDAVAVAVRISGLAHRLQDGELVITRPTTQKQ